MSFFAGNSTENHTSFTCTFIILAFTSCLKALADKETDGRGLFRSTNEVYVYRLFFDQPMGYMFLYCLFFYQPMKQRIKTYLSACLLDYNYMSFYVFNFIGAFPCIFQYGEILLP